MNLSQGVICHRRGYPGIIWQSKKGHGDRKFGAFAILAFDSDGPFHRLSQALYESEPDPDAVVLLGGGCIGLPKPLERRVELILFHSGTIVLHLKDQMAVLNSSRK